MPHFYGIALYRLQDYKSAKLPVLPAKKGARTAQIQIMLYIIIFAAAATALATGGYAGKGYLIVALALSAGWFGLGLSGFRTQEPKLWGRKMFFFSLIVITGLCLAISVDASIS
jgi:protoheme IX farnesyltransferase